MDKDNRDDFTFARLCDIKLPVTLRMFGEFLTFPFRSLMTSRSQLEGVRKPRSFTDVLDNPELKFHGAQSA